MSSQTETPIVAAATFAATNSAAASIEAKQAPSSDIPNPKFKTALCKNYISTIRVPRLSFYLLSQDQANLST